MTLQLISRNSAQPVHTHRLFSALSPSCFEFVAALDLLRPANARKPLSQMKSVSTLGVSCWTLRRSYSTQMIRLLTRFACIFQLAHLSQSCTTIHKQTHVAAGPGAICWNTGRSNRNTSRWSCCKAWVLHLQHRCLGHLTLWLCLLSSLQLLLPSQLDLSPAQLCDAVLAELVLGVPCDAFPIVIMVFFAVVVCLLCQSNMQNSALFVCCA